MHIRKKNYVDVLNVLKIKNELRQTDFSWPWLNDIVLNLSVDFENHSNVVEFKLIWI